MIFKRTEQKYLLTKKQYDELLEEMKSKFDKDKYFESNIENIYFDTDDYYLIVTSMDKPKYKEKIRLRSYSVPSLDDNVFFEIKKKYNKIVSKRRVEIKLKDYYDYINKGIIPLNCNQQIMEELDYSIKRYGLKPKLFLAYDRYSYVAKDNNEFRVTFDYNIRSREDNLNLDYGSKGELLFDDEYYIMELKVLDALPMWFINILNKKKIYPVSFSKYGSIYEKKMELMNYV